MRREATLVPRYARDNFAPGDLVEGVLEVREPIERLRRLDAHLKYLDRSPSYSGAITHASSEPLHEGPLERGQEIPFALRLPADALPNWNGQATEGMGTLSWALVLDTDVARGLDTITTHSVPVDQRAVWYGPQPTGNGSVHTTVKRWDVAIEPDRCSLRRGERLTVAVEIGAPSPERETLQVGLICRADYAVEVRKQDSDGGYDTYRETRRATLLEAWPELDTSATTQTVGFELPQDCPFSYDGTAFAVRWFVLARESRRLRVDPRRSVRLHVLP
jgi:hypothetical protein